VYSIAFTIFWEYKNRQKNKGESLPPAARTAAPRPLLRGPSPNTWTSGGFMKQKSYPAPGTPAHASKLDPRIFLTAKQEKAGVRIRVAGIILAGLFIVVRYIRFYRQSRHAEL
jgi:hypothetical protein